MAKKNEVVASPENPTIELKGEISDISDALQQVVESKEFKEKYSEFEDVDLSMFSYYEDDILRNVDVLTRKIQTWDSETVKSVPSEELEQTFLCLYDNIYILIQNVNPLWQVGMERIKLLKDYQDLYVEMLKVRGEL
ncbi:MAG: hypothetical protein E7274_04900 [Pseudobutyrivibrio ruminis]|uniref:hypothetical protein n=1 Tax=Pseudobutyrivibrio ruminis TaxID=46206 RepID=UPI0026F0CEF8|nr:hypothetical protein [Pseudobutyrivibrio ruminis]MBE5913376.1 hypothetical protein [Pseudobutyrivibrio ruminis]